MTTNLELLKEKLNKLKNPQKGGDGNSKYFKPEDGENLVRLLPYENKEDGLFYVETKNHRVVENGRTNYVTCLYHSSKGETKCPVCQVYYDLWQLADTQGDEKLKKFASGHRAGARYMYNILDRTDNNVKIASVGIKLHEAIGDYFFDEDYGDLTDVEAGYDFKINKTIVDGKWPDYAKSRPVKDASPILTEGDVEGILGQMHDLEAEIKVVPYEELQAMADMILVEASKMSDALSHNEDNLQADEDAKRDGETDTGTSYMDHLDGL